jgi:hypothetical protein
LLELYLAQCAIQAEPRIETAAHEDLAHELALCLHRKRAGVGTAFPESHCQAPSIRPVERLRLSIDIQAARFEHGCTAFDPHLAKRRIQVESRAPTAAATARLIGFCSNVKRRPLGARAEGWLRRAESNVRELTTESTVRGSPPKIPCTQVTHELALRLQRNVTGAGTDLRELRRQAPTTNSVERLGLCVDTDPARVERGAALFEPQALGEKTSRDYPALRKDPRFRPGERRLPVDKELRPSGSGADVLKGGSSVPFDLTVLVTRTKRELCDAA